MDVETRIKILSGKLGQVGQIDSLGLERQDYASILTTTAWQVRATHTGLDPISLRNVQMTALTRKYLNLLRDRFRAFASQEIFDTDFLPDPIVLENVVISREMIAKLRQVIDTDLWDHLLCVDDGFSIQEVGDLFDESKSVAYKKVNRARGIAKRFNTIKGEHYVY